MSIPTDSIAALATPAGSSAIAVLRASGPSVLAMTKDIFGETPPPRLARHSDYRDQRGELVDDVLFTVFAAPNSFTGEDSLEISCHGNPFIAQKILEDLFLRGCRPAEAGEFTKRAFLNGRMDLSQAEAVMDLIRAKSDRALAVANQQLRGALGRQMEDLISLLVNIIAKIEAYVDFPDEDLPDEDRDNLLEDMKGLLAATSRLRATSHFGELLRDGVRTVIVGEPNAGKSSLLNRLVGHERAIVSPEPGTTRDYLEERIVVGAHLLRLIDTAGLNESPTSLEKRGMEKAMEQAAAAELFLWVVDASRPLPRLPDELTKRMNVRNTVLILNKADLPHSVQPHPVFFSLELSALHGTGCEALPIVVNRLIDAFGPTGEEESIAINARHANALAEAMECLESAMKKVSASTSSELIANELRGALDAYGQISGKIDNERVLDCLFASFCIGK